MNANQIKSAVRNAIQAVTDDMDLELGVGPINESDWAYLSGGYGLLNWEVGLTKYGNDDAAILGVFRPETDTLEMHLVESFIRNPQHPLKGRVFEMMVIASYLFIAAVDGTNVRLVDVGPELTTYYRTFGFETDGQDMVQTVSGLAEQFIMIVAGTSDADNME